MIFSKIYSNRPEIFPPIRFRRGLNVILARVRDRKDTTKDSHNLGKTLLIDLLDFCLLCQPDADFFLKKHTDRFSGFVFFLELELHDGGFVTIRRGVSVLLEFLLERCCRDSVASTIAKNQPVIEFTAFHQFRRLRHFLSG
jgi:uncharacterized protein YydD (DUF2326 family)